ncbi:unnamed protein product [Parajaminaea phylloscopi]
MMAAAAERGAGESSRDGSVGATGSPASPQASHTEELRSWSPGGDGDNTDPEDSDEDDDDTLEALREMGVEDADWDLARGDFTKLYNRSRQVHMVASGSSGTSVPLPAMNNARRAAAAKEAREAREAREQLMTRTGGPDSGSGAEAAANRHSGGTTGETGEDAPKDKTTEQLSALSQYASRISLSGSLSGAVPRKANAASGVTREKDKADRATNQQVLDPRTLVILFKMLQRGFLSHIDGVISTGKEANVYHASMPPALSEGETDDTPADVRKGPASHVAIKIYKTSILVFKDRHQYVSGEYRFRNGYTGSNPRKMVKTWAEKEARNLKRLVSAGIRAPKPLELRDHVLVMDFLGDDEGWASPRLKDAEKLIDEEESSSRRWQDLYREMLVAMRVMWWHCRLVHADLSEYNVLYHEKHLWIIDVSQSVEHDHPKALDFLRADISHVEAYFSKRGGVDNVLGLRSVFDWILKEPAARRLGRKTGGRVGIDQEFEADVRATESGEMLEQATGAGEAAPPGSVETVLTRGTGPFASVEIRAREAGETEEELMRELELMMDQGSGPAAISPSHHNGTGTPASTEDQASSSAKAQQEQSSQDEAVFMSSYIPRTLNEVYDPERDIRELKQRGPEGLIYAGGVTGLGQAQQGPTAGPQSAKADGAHEVEKTANGADGSGAEDDSDSSDSDSEGDEDREGEGGDSGDGIVSGTGNEHVPRAPRGHRHEDRDARKQRKAEVKEAQRERRQSKMSKKDKAKKIKKTKATK